MLNFTECARLFATARDKETGKPIANNTRVVKRADGYAVRLHKTDVLTFLANGAVRYDSGGWRTVTTKARMNEYGPASIHSDKGVWYISAGRNPKYNGGNGEPWPKCQECGEDMDRDNSAGERVNDGRALYGLTFHDPNFDPGKAVIGKDCSDRTLGDGAQGKTVADAEKSGESLGLERYQAIYSASSKWATERHTVPSIDGACGMSSVQRIAEAIGLTVQTIDAGSKRDVIIVSDTRAEAAA